MTQQTTLQGYVIKTQDLNEADLLVTFFSLKSGKIRFLAKSAKKIASKLQGRLQPNCLLQVELTANGTLPKIIGSEVLTSYATLFANQKNMQAVLTMQELLLRSLPDEQSNSALYQNYSWALQELDSQSGQQVLILIRFFILALESLGFAPMLIQQTTDISEKVFYNLAEGKFKTAYENSSDQMITSSAYLLLYELINSGSNMSQMETQVELLEILSAFAGYQLERNLKSVQFFLQNYNFQTA